MGIYTFILSTLHPQIYTCILFLFREQRILFQPCDIFFKSSLDFTLNRYANKDNYAYTFVHVRTNKSLIDTILNYLHGVYNYNIIPRIISFI